MPVFRNLLTDMMNANAYESRRALVDVDSDLADVDFPEPLRYTVARETGDVLAGSKLACLRVLESFGLA
eukprot:4134281-Alexandrium_andersonii.AAC.1